jgi:hypothetical protein
VKLQTDEVKAILQAFAEHEYNNPGDYLTLDRVSLLLRDADIDIPEIGLKNTLAELCHPSWLEHDNNGFEFELHGFRIGTRGEIWLAASTDYVEIFENALDPSLKFPSGATHLSSATEPELAVRPPTAHSIDWTGLSKKVSIANLSDIKAKISALKASIDQSDADYQTKMNAFKRADAIQCLLEAPDVPWREIVELLQSPYFTAFLSALSLAQFIIGLGS